MSRINFIKVFTFVICFIFPTSQAYSSLIGEEPVQRDWCSSLNIQIGGAVIINMDDWFLQNPFVNRSTQQAVQRHARQPGDPNIAQYNLTFFYKRTNSNDIERITFSDNLLFLSGNWRGLAEAKNNLSISVMNGLDFIDGNEVNQELFRNLAHIMGVDTEDLGNYHIKEGAHAEALVLMHIEGSLRNFLVRITDFGDSTIIGTTLQLSSLKDPCEGCTRMLMKAASNFTRLIRETNTHSNITIPHNIANTWLVASQERFATSYMRRGLPPIPSRPDTEESIPINRRRIEIDFDNPIHQIKFSVLNWMNIEYGE